MSSAEVRKGNTGTVPGMVEDSGEGAYLRCLPPAFTTLILSGNKHKRTWGLIKHESCEMRSCTALPGWTLGSRLYDNLCVHVSVRNTEPEHSCSLPLMTLRSGKTKQEIFLCLFSRCFYVFPGFYFCVFPGRLRYVSSYYYFVYAYCVHILLNSCGGKILLLNQAWMFVNAKELVLTLVLSLQCFTSTKLQILTQKLEERFKIANFLTLLALYIRCGGCKGSH
jgi:hypothetical protein